MAQGAGQSIESAYELFKLIKEDRSNIATSYFQMRYERAKIIRRRSDFNFFIFHFSSKIMQKIRNIFLKLLVKRRSIINSYVGIVFKN